MMIPAMVAMVACGSGETDSQEQDPAQEQENADNTTAMAEIGYYGDTISVDGALNTSEMLAALEGKDSAMVKVSGEILDVCQKKGCWMKMPLGNDESMTVKFKDYAFFVPMNSTGQTATIEGVVKQETYSVAELKHLAEDAGKSQEEIDAITEPEVRYSFMANGVAIK